MSVGLMQDQEYNTENFNLFKYNNIYFPDENYYNTNEFPKVWMEIFDSKVNIVKRTQQDHTDLAIYAPNCTNKELARMLHAESEKRMKYKNTESKLKEYISGSMTYQETMRLSESRANQKNIKVGQKNLPKLSFKEIKRSMLM